MYLLFWYTTGRAIHFIHLRIDIWPYGVRGGDAKGASSGFGF